MVWAICILQESEHGEKDIKDKYCLKHPGYEQLFFCKTWNKGVWEKCIRIHSDHEVVTIVLEAQKLFKDLDIFKNEFGKMEHDWDTLFNKFTNKKEHFEFEVSKISKQIENYFDEFIKKLEDSKRKYLEAFGSRAKGEIQEFLDEYDGFTKEYTNVKNK